MEHGKTSRPFFRRVQSFDEGFAGEDDSVFAGAASVFPPSAFFSSVFALSPLPLALEFSDFPDEEADESFLA